MNEACPEGAAVADRIKVAVAGVNALDSASSCKQREIDLEVMGEDSTATQEDLKGEMCAWRSIGDGKHEKRHEVICMEGPEDGVISLKSTRLRCQTEDTPFVRLYCGHCFHRGCECHSVALEHLP